MSDHSNDANTAEDAPNLDRRRMLMRLGLAATAIYSAPVLLQLNEAHASGGSGGGRGGSGGGRGGGSGGRGGRGSGGRGSGGRGSGRGRGGQAARGFGGHRGSWGSGARRGGNRGNTTLSQGLMRDLRDAFGR